MRQNAFLNRVRNLLKDEDVKREARALVTEECASISDQSENTVYVTDDLAHTRQAERDISAMEAVSELRQVGVRVTKAFLKRVRTAQAFGDDIPHYSKCEDGRGRPRALSDAYSNQLTKIVRSCF